MAGRVKNDRHSNASFEVLGAELNDLRVAQDALSNPTTSGGAPGAPTVVIPFKVTQRQDTDGIYITCEGGIDPNCEELVISVIRKEHNQVNIGETPQAARDRAKARLKHYPFDIADNERTSGIFNREIGPFKFRHQKDSTDAQLDRNRFELVRLKGNNGFGFAKNPASDPTDDANLLTQPITTPVTVVSPLFPVLQVNNTGHSPDDSTYFSLLATGASGPSLPALSLIVCNTVDPTTEARTGKVTVRVRASINNTGVVGDVSFENVGASEVYAIFRKVGDTTDEPIKFGGVISDPTQTFIDIDCLFPIGKNFEWRRNTLVTSGGNQKNTATGVTFYAGGTSDLTRLTHAVSPSISDPVLTPTPQDSHFTELNFTFSQPVSSATCTPSSSPVLIERVRFQKQRPDTTWKTIYHQNLLDDSSFFIVDVNNPNPKSITYEAKHKANVTTNFRVELIGVGLDGAGNKPTAYYYSNGNSSSFAGHPAVPVAGDIVSAPDGETTQNDAYADITIHLLDNSNNPITITNAGATMAHVKIKRLLADGGGKSFTYGGPIDLTIDGGNTSVTVRVPGLKLGKVYTLHAVFIGDGGGEVRAVPASTLSFTAGYTGVGTYDATRLSAVDKSSGCIVVTRVNKRHSHVVGYYSQAPVPPDPTPLTPHISQEGNPIYGPPVLVKNAKLFMKLPAGPDNPADAAFIKVAQVRLKDDPDFSDNTTTLLKTVDFGKIEHPQSLSNIQYYMQIDVVEGDFIYAPYQQFIMGVQAENRQIADPYIDTRSTDPDTSNFGSVTIAITSTAVDDHHTLLTATITESNPFTDLKRLVISRKLPATDDNGNALDTVEHNFEHVDLVNDEDLQVNSAVKAYQFLAHHPKHVTGITWKATIKTYGGLSKFATVTGNSGSGDMTIPGYTAGDGSGTNQSINHLKIRWKDNGGLRIKFRIPNMNMDTYETTVLRLNITGLTSGIEYTWNPDEAVDVGYTTPTISGLAVTADANQLYVLDIGRTGHITAACDQVHVGGIGPAANQDTFPSVAYSHLQTGSTITVDVFVLNDIGPLNFRGSITYDATTDKWSKY